MTKQLTFKIFLLKIKKDRINYRFCHFLYVIHLGEKNISNFFLICAPFPIFSYWICAWTRGQGVHELRQSGIVTHKDPASHIIPFPWKAERRILGLNVVGAVKEHGIKAKSSANSATKRPLCRNWTGLAEYAPVPDMQGDAPQMKKNVLFLKKKEFHRHS